MNILKLIPSTLLLVALQVLVLNHVHLFGCATPMIVSAILMYFPQSASRTQMLLWSFATGFIVDTFTGTPGVCSGSMTFTAMCRPFLLNLQIPKDEDEDVIPSFQSMGRWNHVRFVFSLLLVHLAVYHMLESFSFFHISDVMLNFVTSLMLSFFLLLLIDSFRKK